MTEVVSCDRRDGGTYAGVGLWLHMICSKRPTLKMDFDTLTICLKKAENIGQQGDKIF